MRQDVSAPVEPKITSGASHDAEPPVQFTSKLLSLAVGIATRGRAAVLIDTLQHLGEQTRRADRILVCYTEPRDVGDAPRLFPEIVFFQSEAGLTRQRNSILRALKTEDVVVFLDDDFYLRPEYLASIERVFADHKDVVVATGKVLADGINGPGLTFEAAKRTLLAKRPGKPTNKISKAFNAYGCNMALRMEPVRDHDLRFDEALPLYGWYEDVDFSRQVAHHGRVVRVQAAHGVHLGVKGGRQSGMRLGYSQISNPVYLARKGSVSWIYAWASMVSRSLKNLVMSVKPEKFVDRRGRLQGNLKAWNELIKGQIHPTRILEL